MIGEGIMWLTVYLDATPWDLGMCICPLWTTEKKKEGWKRRRKQANDNGKSKKAICSVGINKFKVMGSMFATLKREKVCEVMVSCFLLSSSQENRAVKPFRSGRFMKWRVYEEAVRYLQSYPAAVQRDNCSAIIYCLNCCFLSSGPLGCGLSGERSHTEKKTQKPGIVV